MSVRFELRRGGAAYLTLVGIDSEDERKQPIRLTVNGTDIHAGPNPLPNDFGPRGEGNWGSYRWALPKGLLRKGANLIVLDDLRASDCVNCSKFVMIDYAVITWR
jgi:hypothetical protein